MKTIAEEAQGIAANWHKKRCYERNSTVGAICDNCGLSRAANIETFIHRSLRPLDDADSVFSL
jgi:hypothetical protein